MTAAAAGELSETEPDAALKEETVNNEMEPVGIA